MTSVTTLELAGNLGGRDTLRFETVGSIEINLDGGKDSGQKLTDVSYRRAAKPCNPSQAVATIRARSTHRTSH
jgi:hypothetical protein